MSMSPVSSSSTAAAASVLTQATQADATRNVQNVRSDRDNEVRVAAAEADRKPPPIVNSEGQIVGTRINTTA